MMTNYFKHFVYLFVLLGIASVFAGAYEDFFDAVNRDDGVAVQALVKRGFDPNSRNPVGQTALHLALRDRSPRVVKALLDSPALDVNAHNASGESPLMMAALRGNLELARILLERGAKVHQDGWSPLHDAATGPEPRLVALLLDRGAPIDALSVNKTTPLMMAAGYGAEDSLNLLLQKGADLRLRNDLGLGPSDFARQGGREALTKQLRDAERR